MLVIFDVEGVLVDDEFLPELARKVGKEKEVMDITLAGIRGEIDWTGGLKRRIEVLKGMSYADVIDVADSMILMMKAKEACWKLKEAGVVLVGVSGGFGVFVDRFKKDLGLDYVFSNDMVFHDGKLAGIELKVNSNKVLVLKDLIKRLAIKKEETVAVVDGANDLPLFDIADLKVAFNAQEVVKKHADVVIEEKDLSEILPHVLLPKSGFNILVVADLKDVGNRRNMDEP